MCLPPLLFDDWEFSAITSNLNPEPRDFRSIKSLSNRKGQTFGIHKNKEGLKFISEWLRSTRDWLVPGRGG